MTPPLHKTSQAMGQVTSPMKGETHNQFQPSYQFSLHPIRLCVSSQFLTHEQHSCTLTLTHQDSGSFKWIQIVTLQQRRFMVRGSIQTPLSSPLWTIGWMRPIVTGDWWVWKNETASILTPTLKTRLGGNWVNWPRRQLRITWSQCPNAWMYVILLACPHSAH